MPVGKLKFRYVELSMYARMYVNLSTSNWNHSMINEPVMFNTTPENLFLHLVWIFL